MKNEENRLEERLLSNASLDELIKMKMEEELKQEFKKSKEKITQRIETDIKCVPKELIFSKRAIYKVFNKINKTETYINGLQAESMLGVQNLLREKIKNAECDVFSTDFAYIKFDKIKLAESEKQD